MTSPPIHTRVISPQSPLPVHPIAPASIPVLANQIDPHMSMDSTYPSGNPVANGVGESADGADLPEAAQTHDMNGTVNDAATTRLDDAGIHETDAMPGPRVTDEDMTVPPTNGQAVADTKAEDRTSDTLAIAEQVDARNNNDSSLLAARTTMAALPSSDGAGPTAEAEPSEDVTMTHGSVNEAPSQTPGDIDIQRLLDDITANTDSKTSAAPTLSPSTGLPAHASLPPRPQLLHQPAVLSYNRSEIQSPANGGAYPAMPSVQPSSAPGTTAGTGYLPPPPATFAGAAMPLYPPGAQPAQSPIPGVGTDAALAGAGDGVDLESDKPWPPQVQKLYDDFLADERRYVTEGAWEKFPTGSRLFIGNLPSEKVTKRDLFHVFHKYGRLAQVSIKQAYGFVQYHDAASCRQALETEQDQPIKGRKMHLEISKAQRNTRNKQQRSRSPTDRTRGGRGNRNNAGDRYDGRQGARDDGGRGSRRGDGYRPGRSPSPRGGFRGSDAYGSDRGRDHYDGRDRRRSRSRSPIHGSRDHGRYRERSPSPRSREAIEDADLPIPRRAPHEIPDVQILLLEELDRNFIGWVENELRSRGVKSEVLFVSHRLPLQVVIRRQILEGVHAVTLLNMRAQSVSKIPLQIFDRQGGATNVRFDEYQDLDPKVAAELVLRAKNASMPVQYAPPPQPYAPVQQPYHAGPPQATALPNLAGLVGQLDNNTLQQLLSTLNAAPQAQNPSAPSMPAGVDLAALLGGMRGPPAQQMAGGPAPPPPSAAAAQHVQHAQPYTDPRMQGMPQYQNGAAPSYGSAPPAAGASQQSAQQVQDIMAQLARFRQ